MLDIALIREKPDWVKEQISKLYDEAALARIDKILKLDAGRREIRTKTETAQAARNTAQAARETAQVERETAQVERDAERAGRLAAEAEVARLREQLIRMQQD